MTEGTKIDDARLAGSLAAALAEAGPDLEARMATDPEAYLDLVTIAAKAERQTEELLRSAVAAARSAGQSWEAIGARLGISRQAAQKRFGRADEDEAPEGGVGAPAGAGEVRVVSGLTAFNEMRVLERLGRHGWHSIGYGMLHHVVRRSDRQWEHVRLMAGSDAVEPLLEAGWQRVGRSWFPWVYLKRQLDLPALPEEGAGPASAT
ncbi:MAG TPA: hypothetical protein VF202_14470 [Trueperaceae bacterium]